MKTNELRSRLTTVLTIAIMIIATATLVPTKAEAVEISYEEIDGIVYVGVLCDNGVEGRGTFLTRSAARMAAIDYCRRFG